MIGFWFWLDFDVRAKHQKFKIFLNASILLFNRGLADMNELHTPTTYFFLIKKKNEQNSNDTPMKMGCQIFVYGKFIRV